MSFSVIEVWQDCDGNVNGLECIKTFPTEWAAEDFVSLNRDKDWHIVEIKEGA